MRERHVEGAVGRTLTIALDGTPAETVDAEAKDLAAKQLARIEARNAATQTASAKAKPKPPAEKKVRPGDFRKR
jgi:sRNA-binding protein